MGLTVADDLLIERDGNGDFILDTEALAARFRMSLADFRRNMAQGRITSMVEAGRDEDEGRYRLTVRFGNRVWRAVVDASGTVSEESLGFASPRC
ncbi:MAG: DUF6522 family protein [Pseudochelatococcus sp.]